MGEQVPWQIKGPYPSLVNNIKALTASKENQRILVPLCGASDDLLWLADQGHTVVGIEITKTAIEVFFKKNNLEYEISAINLAPSGAYIYKAKDKNITIVEINVFHFQQSIVGDLFDAVWDRAALIAALDGTAGEQEIEIGKKYLKVLRDVLRPDGRVLVENFVYDPNERPAGPGPHLVTNDVLKAICGDGWDMQIVDMVPVKAGQAFSEKTFSYDIEMYLHLLTPK